MDSARIEELIIASRSAAFLDDPSNAVRELDEAISKATDPGHIGHLLLARGVAQQGASDIGPAASDSQASIKYLLESGDTSAAAFAMSCAAGMVQRTGDMAAALDLAVEAMVQLPEHELNDEYLVRAANGMALLFAQFSAFDLAIASSRRAFEGSMEQPDHNTRSIAAYTLGYCAVEAIRSGQIHDGRRLEFENDLSSAIDWLVSPGAGPMERAILGSGMRAEQVLLQHLGDDPNSTTVATERSSLLGALILLEQGSDAYPNTAPRLGAWHRLVTATVLRNLSEPERAEALLNQAVPGLVNTGDEHRIIRAFNERSTARTMTGDLLGALDDSREAARLSRYWQQYQGARLAVQISRRADLEQARSQLRRRADDLAKIASEDPVTGLATRRWLELQLDILTRSEGQGAVVVLDLDRFKMVNDTFGHQTGDVVLREVGQILRTVVRAKTPVARFGGEEFVVLLPGLDGAAGMALAERIRVAINRFDWASVAEGLHVTVSAGVAHGPLAGVRELVRLADTALYDAKRAGRNRVIGF